MKTKRNTFQEYFDSAKEYYRNARGILGAIPIELGAFYKSRKRVQTAAGICYLALDSAIKGFLIN